MVTLSNKKKSELSFLEKEGFTPVSVKTAYEQARWRGRRVSVVLYKTGKLLLQGDPVVIEELVYTIEENTPDVGVIIGSDETLKGDTFGGIVVAGVKANAAVRMKLVKLGVQDSKRMKDDVIKRLAPKIETICESVVYNLYPAEYNDLYAKLCSMTAVLDKLHGACGAELKPGKHIVDHYPGCQVGDERKTKAEEKHIEVAAASIIARFYAIEQIHALTAQAGFKIPLGSTHVKQALAKITNRKSFIKLHFKNTS